MGGEKPILLRANWKNNENDVDDEVKEKFETLCSKDLDTEFSGGREHILEGGYRNWHDGNEIGKHEKDALHAVGFITDRHTYILNEHGMVVNIDSFWRAQINFDEGLWPKRNGKRLWKDLWEIALSDILKKCEDIGALTECEEHLRESIRLREMKAEEYTSLAGYSAHMPRELIVSRSDFDDIYDQHIDVLRKSADPLHIGGQWQNEPPLQTHERPQLNVAPHSGIESDDDRPGVKRKMTEEDRNHISMIYCVGKALTLTIRRLYYTHSDKALKAIDLKKKHCTMPEVWSTDVPNEILNFNNKSKLTKCQTHLKMALEWRKKEYEQKKKQERDDSHLK